MSDKLSAKDHSLRQEIVNEIFKVTTQGLRNKILPRLVTLRTHALYSTVDGSRHGYSWLVGKKKKYAYRLMSEEGKKIKGKFHELYSIFGGFNIFFTIKDVIAENIYGMSVEKIK